MSRVLIALGGTGQVALHYYLQLHLLGLAPNDAPLKTLVIDQDRLNEGLRFCASLFATIGRELPDGTLTPSLQQLRFDVDGAASIGSLLMGDNAPMDHPARALLDPDSLRQNVTDGLFRRPALASVLWRRYFPQIKDELDETIRGADRVVVVGSSSGGVGGGFLVPITAYIRNALQGARVTAVVFENYFTHQDMSDVLAKTYASNSCAVGRYLADWCATTTGFAVEHLHFLTGNVQRNAESEVNARRLNPPDATGDPFGETAQIIIDSFLDTRDDRPATLAQATSGFPTPGEIRKTWTRYRETIPRIQEALDLLTSERMASTFARDPWATYLWGRPLVEYVQQAWTAWMRPAPDVSISKFNDLFDRAVSGWYVPAADEYGVAQFLPRLDSSHRRGLANLRAVSKVLGRVAQDYWRSNQPPDATLRRHAAALVGSILKGGVA